MADIDVVPKRSSMTWLWIVIAVVVILALWWLMGRSSSTPQTGELIAPPHTLTVSTSIVTV